MYWSVFSSHYHLSFGCLPSWRLYIKIAISNLLGSILTYNCLSESMALTISKSPLKIHFISINFVILFSALRNPGNSWWNIISDELYYEFINEQLRRRVEFHQVMVGYYFYSYVKGHLNFKLEQQNNYKHFRILSDFILFYFWIILVSM